MDKPKNFTVISGGSSVADTKDFDKITITAKDLHNALGAFMIKIEIAQTQVGMVHAYTGQKPTPEEARKIFTEAAADVYALLRKSGIEITEGAVQ